MAFCRNLIRPLVRPSRLLFGRAEFSNDGNGIRQLETLEKSLNQVTILGRVGNNPEQRGSAENPVVTFSMATNINYSKGDEIVQTTDWHRVCAFKPNLRDKITRFLAKGSRVLVTGRISYFEKKDDSNSSISHKIASIIADDVIFLQK